jgi:hypothetical protein
MPGRGMGLEFVQMLAEARARLNQFLLQQEAPHKVPVVPPVSNLQAATSVAGVPTDQLLFERELKRLIEVAGKGTYYDLLGVNAESSDSQIKRSYYALAKKFHMRCGTRVTEAPTIISWPLRAHSIWREKKSNHRKLGKTG